MGFYSSPHVLQQLATPILFIKIMKPKFQVEVSHPKEIHLATCSPSIFKGSC
ncbi:Uncharacterised protein [Streptococcus pneumoniae]|nr:Uncharacterised protein [Streptococcus pneumoniae]